MKLKMILSALLLLGAAVVLTPTASADIGACADDLYHPGFKECYGYMQSCDGSAGWAAIGHWYTYSGGGDGWCYVELQDASGGHLLAVCTETEYGTPDRCLVSIL